MFSDINKVTEKLPIASERRTHQSDTRDEIRRHDPDQERKKDSGKGFAKEQGLFGEDQTEISISSLEAFLPMLLKNYAPQSTGQTKSSIDVRVDKSSPNARAAGAYAKIAQYSGPVESLRYKARDVKSNDDVLDKDPKLSTEEVKAIYSLQSDVKKLKAKGVHSLEIKKAGTFLESLQNAVASAL